MEITVTKYKGSVYGRVLYNYYKMKNRIKNTILKSQ